MKNSILTFAVLASISISVNAFALSSSEVTFSHKISVAKYNLNNKAGAKAAYRHIREEAQTACGVSTGRVSIRAKTVQKKCIANLTNQAVVKFNAPSLTRIHQINRNN